MLQEVKEQHITYKDFVNGIACKVKERLGEGYSVHIYKVLKNNALELDSLIVRKEDKNFAPNIYLMPYYESYLEGTTFDQLVDRLVSIYQHCSVPMIDETFEFTFEEMKTYIIFRLVNFEKNRKLLEGVPHERFLDLAVTFHCLVRNDKEGIGTIRITNEHLKLWEVEQKDLKAFAFRNTHGYFPSAIRSLEEVVKEMVYYDGAMDEERIIDEMYIDQPDQEDNFSKHKLYILTNQKGINGASCMLYEDVLRNFALQIKSDFYILPSSIHEIILVPIKDDIKKDTLVEMVRDVNRSQVAPEEVLSDQVYYYSIENNQISL